MARARTAREPRVPQQARSRRTRERVLEAAVACFTERGFDRTTTAQIARRAELGVGSLYGYFRDKRSILLELLHGSVDEIADAVLKGLDPGRWRGRAPRAAVRELIDLIFHSQRMQPGVQRVIWERYFKDEAFRAAAISIETRIRAALEALLGALAADGRVRVANPHAAAFVVHAAVQWTASRLVVDGADIDLETAADAVADMISAFLFRDADAP